MRRFLLFCALLFALFCAPNLWMRATTDMLSVQEAPKSDAALIFGAIVRQGQISPLHQERLDTGIALLRAGKVDKLIVSNAPEAARVMKAYLMANGLLQAQIEVDPTAIRTPDSCIFEAAQGKGRSVIFVSQKFHLPRIAQHCAPFALRASFVYADADVRAPMPWHRVATIRTQRFLRESALSWSILLGLYPDD